MKRKFYYLKKRNCLRDKFSRFLLLRIFPKFAKLNPHEKKKIFLLFFRISKTYTFKLHSLLILLAYFFWKVSNNLNFAWSYVHHYFLCVSNFIMKNIFFFKYFATSLVASSILSILLLYFFFIFYIYASSIYLYIHTYCMFIIYACIYI